MVNTEELRNELKQYSDIIFCGVNNENSYVIVVENYTQNIELFQEIITTYVISEYPNNISISFKNDILKAEYAK